MTKENWHNDLVDLLKGFGEADGVDVCNATYVAKKIFGLRMPEDYVAEGKHMVSNTTVIREHYLITEIRRSKELQGNIADTHHYFIGKVLSKLKRVEEVKEDPLKLCALYLAWTYEQRKSSFNSKEYNLAKNTVQKLKKVKSRIESLDKAVSELCKT